METRMPSHHNLPSPAINGTIPGKHLRRKMLMHMTFFWGKNAEVLFPGWPGNNTAMYALALVFVFALAVLVEYLSHSHLIKPGTSDAVAGILQTGLHATRSGIAYMVMLAVMSFNGGIFVAAVGGHAFGFLVFGSRVFRKAGSDQQSDLPPVKC